MLPILPILILLFLGPVNADRLAAEGRLPAALLAVHLARSVPARIVVAAPVEKAEGVRKPCSTCGARPSPSPLARIGSQFKAVSIDPGCPPRAGPSVA